jgi:predicted acylesterase/phospholipase RssA
MIGIQTAASGGECSEPRVGMALAGGGAVGIVYEVGVLKALDEAIEGLSLGDLHVYVGVSAGALVAASLANQLSAHELGCVLIDDGTSTRRFRPETLMRPALSRYLRSAVSLPALIVEAFDRYLQDPEDGSLLESLTALGRAIPAGVFENESLQAFFAELFSQRGRSNDFRRLQRRLEVVAVDLDTGESVKFGSPGYDHVPISRACQASSALPGLYPPVKIDGCYYVDGVLQKTLHASVALEAGARLVLCVNPIVPFDASLADSEEISRIGKLAQGGLPVVLSQTFRAIIHSRMQVGFSRYESQYPHADVILFEPDVDDPRMFFTNVFSFANRQHVCEHAYQITRRDLRGRRQELAPIFARHGLSLREDVLDDRERHFWTDIEKAQPCGQHSPQRHSVSDELGAGLDRLEGWLDSQS